MPPTEAMITAQTIGYHQRQPISGMYLKFIP